MEIGLCRCSVEFKEPQRWNMASSLVGVPITLLGLSKHEGIGNNVASAPENSASSFVQWSQSGVSKKVHVGKEIGFMSCP